MPSPPTNATPSKKRVRIDEYFTPIPSPAWLLYKHMTEAQDASALAERFACRKRQLLGVALKAYEAVNGEHTPSAAMWLGHQMQPATPLRSPSTPTDTERDAELDARQALHDSLFGSDGESDESDSDIPLYP